MCKDAKIEFNKYYISIKNAWKLVKFLAVFGSISKLKLK